VFIKNEAKVTDRVWAVSSEDELILASCCLSPMKRNSVLDEFYLYGTRVKFVYEGHRVRGQGHESE